MTPERAVRLALWLRLLAETEEQTALVLEKMGARADPEPCLEKARLLREIADHLIHSPASEPSPAPEPDPDPSPDEGRPPDAPIRALL